ncbi:class I SAM-dependent methyltransferase [Gorillibacterium sp. sgz5001074]|uniref:class I SAM-dependent methyltransferase n=1 Tax=Gorillibacterium sp. sgz5001074 TaxID=3446695 RepID=UPI003F6641C9
MLEVLKYYDRYDEDGRLERDNYHRAEFAITVKLLEPYLPAGAQILDAGAGTGRYSLHYAALGHRVTALDLTPKHVELIRGKADGTGLGHLVDAVTGNAMDLSAYADGTFDAVLCMGPLYHMKDGAEREACMRECLRVLKPGGLLAAAYVNLAGNYLYKLMLNPKTLVLEPPTEILTRKIEWEEGCFASITPEEAEELMARFPMEKLEHATTDGISALMQNTVNALNAEQFAQWLECLYVTNRNPHFLGTGLHNLYIARKIPL